MNSHNHHDTDEAVLALSVHQPAFFSVIVGRYQDAFMQKARNILRNEEDACDVVQEALVRIYAAAPRFRVQEGARFSSWAYKILINQCFTMFKKRKHEIAQLAALDADLAEVLPDAHEMAEREQRMSAEYLLSLISRLPAMLGQAVRLHFIEGKPQKEIAAMEGVAEGTIRARIHRAKQELRKMHITL
jgi:RNA polymerase sigma factor (sigma-70 family)